MSQKMITDLIRGFIKNGRYDYVDPNIIKEIGLVDSAKLIGFLVEVYFVFYIETYFKDNLADVEKVFAERKVGQSYPDIILTYKGKQFRLEFKTYLDESTAKSSQFPTSAKKGSILRNELQSEKYKDTDFVVFFLIKYNNGIFTPYDAIILSIAKIKDLFNIKIKNKLLGDYRSIKFGTLEKLKLLNKISGLEEIDE